MSEDCVRLSGMTFTGHHGVLEAERELGQPFVVDVALRLDLAPAAKADDLSETVDYRRVHDRAKETVEGEPVALIETLAERIAALVLADDPRVEEVRVGVAKPNVRLGDTVLSGSSVEIVRPRRKEVS